MEKLHFDLVILGAGAAGLSLAEKASQHFSKILVLERHESFGAEISSHNSEVIHAGIYYEGMPLKSRHCTAGNKQLYAFCERYEVPFRRTGKYILAYTPEQREKLQKIYNFGLTQAPELHWLEGNDLPADHKAAVAALWSPNSGILDSHNFMYRCEQLARGRGAVFQYRHTFLRVTDRNKTLQILVQDPQGEEILVHCDRFVNAAGLAAAKVAAQFGLAGWETKACRGRYFSLASAWTGKFSQLLYPVPDPRGGLGVHLTFDLSGKCRLGPDVDWTRQHEVPDDRRLYQFSAADEAEKENFWRVGKQLIPELSLEQLQPDYIGVRPKLFHAGTAHPDFHIAQTQTGQDWHLLGIESPGLTAAPSLAAQICTEMTKP